MKLLAFDTACSGCSVAFWSQNSVIASARLSMVRGQAEVLMPMIRDVLNKAGSNFIDLDGVAVTVGPGSFTGVRTGLAGARGIALARGLSIIGVTTTETIATEVHQLLSNTALRQPITIVLDSRRKELYVQHFASDLSAEGPPFSASAQVVAQEVIRKQSILAGNAAAQVAAIISKIKRGFELICSPVRQPNAETVAAIAATRIIRLPSTKAVNFDDPLYLKPPEAKAPKFGGRLRR